MAIKYTKLTQYIPNGLKNTNIFHFIALKNIPKLVFWVSKYTIWQPWLRLERFVRKNARVLLSRLNVSVKSSVYLSEVNVKRRFYEATFKVTHCQILIGTYNIPKTGNNTLRKCPENILNGHKLHQISSKYTNKLHHIFTKFAIYVREVHITKFSYPRPFKKKTKNRILECKYTLWQPCS
jgi:hypothetical protein